MVVYAVDEEETFEQAERVLSYLTEEGVADDAAAVILVANKTDLVRSRVVSANGETCFCYAILIFFEVSSKVEREKG